MAQQTNQNQLDPELVKTVAAVLLFSGVLGFFYWKYMWAPYSLRITKAEQRITEINGDIAKAMVMAKRLDTLNQEIAALKKRQQQAETQMPRGKNQPDLIRTLVGVARSYGVEIISIVPQGTQDKPYFSETNYNMAMTGDYHAIGRFISAIMLSDRIFSVKNLAISGAGKNLSATFVLVAYQYKG